MEKEKKEELIEKVKNWLEFDTRNFKNAVLPGSKYKLEVLKNDDSDYKVLESLLELSNECKDSDLAKRNSNLAVIVYNRGTCFIQFFAQIFA